jgi:hypothetical protein
LKALRQGELGRNLSIERLLATMIDHGTERTHGGIEVGDGRGALLLSSLGEVHIGGKIYRSDAVTCACLNRAVPDFVHSHERLTMTMCGKRIDIDVKIAGLIKPPVLESNQSVITISS